MSTHQDRCSEMTVRAARRSGEVLQTDYIVIFLNVWAAIKKQFLKTLNFRQTVIGLQPIKTRAELDSSTVIGLQPIKTRAEWDSSTVILKQIFYEYHPLSRRSYTFDGFVWNIWNKYFTSSEFHPLNNKLKRINIYILSNLIHFELKQ